MSNDPTPGLAVVTPAGNAAGPLARSLAPLPAMRRRGELAEPLVVDDGSTDASAELAQRSPSGVWYGCWCVAAGYGSGYVDCCSISFITFIVAPRSVIVGRNDGC